jgi:trimeric autotransporter adhesin
LNNTVLALAVVGNDLYVGGRFTQTGDGSLANLGHVARYDTSTGTWHALNNQGLDNTVYALTVVGSDLYVGGEFTQTGDGSLANLGRIARYDTTAGTWHELPNQGLDGAVYALAVSGDDLYMGGGFTQTGDGALTDLGNIARYYDGGYLVYLPFIAR